MKTFQVLAALLSFCVSLAEENGESAGPYAPKSSEAHALLTFQEGQQMSVSTFSEDGKEKYTGKVKYGVSSDVPTGISGDEALILTEKAKHYGLVSKFSSPTNNEGKDFVLQYEVRHTAGQTCGGAYLKLIDQDFVNNELAPDTPYIIMFGPDKCGQNDKVHFILRHQNPISKEWEEKHFTGAPKTKGGSETHLYTLVIHQDDTFKIKIDNVIAASGSFMDDMSPSLTPPEQIDDPNDKKPEDWVDEKKIKDPTATKPDDWDEDAPEKIPDPSVEKPEDWDDEDDGEFEAPMIDNPEYKGKWQHPLIDNPEYKGEWVPEQIDNPNYFEPSNIANLPAIGAVGIEIWTMDSGIVFDNIYVGYDEEAASNFAEDTWKVKVASEKSNQVEIDRAARQKELDRLYSEGGFANMAMWVFKRGMAAVQDNPIAAIFTIIAVVGMTIYLCCKTCCGCGDDDEEEEFEAPRRQTNTAESQRGSEEEISSSKKEEKAEENTKKVEKADADQTNDDTSEKESPKKRKSSKRKKKKKKKVEE